MRGIVAETFVDLSEATTTISNGLPKPVFGAGFHPRQTGCGILPADFQVFRKHDVRYFFYIGGNDSSDTVRIVNEYASREGHELRAIHSEDHRQRSAGQRSLPRAILPPPVSSLAPSAGSTPI